MLKKTAFMISLVFISVSILSLISCKNGGPQEMKFGKDLTITVHNDETVDAKHLRCVLEGEIKKNEPYFDLWDAQELEKLIGYMEKNDFILVEGRYIINQTTTFDKAVEIFQFEQKE